MFLSPKLRVLVLCVGLALVARSPVRAQEPDEPPSASQSTPTLLTQRLRKPGPDATVKERQAYWSIVPLPEPDPPKGLERKRPLSDFQRRQKRAQKPVSVIGLPVLGGNPDFGFVVGAVTAATWYGDPADPYYDYSAFDKRLLVEGHVALKRKPNVVGRQSYRARYSVPYVAGSLVSLSVEGAFLMDANTQYFGSTAETMGSLSDVGPGELSGRSFGSYGAYLATLRNIDASGQTYAVYNQYLFQEPRLNATAKLDLLGGILVPTAALKIAHAFVERYGGERVRGVDGTARSHETKLDQDCASGVARHCAGTWDNTVKLALTLDLRDLPVDPDQGVLLDASFEIGPELLGSPGYWRSTQSLAVYVSPLQMLFDLDTKWSQLVFAGRVLYSVSGGDLPFYAINRLSFNDRTLNGLGGINTMRGFRLNRFVGPVMALSNLELRYDLFFYETNRSALNAKLVAFYDTGRAWDEVGDTNFRGYRHDGGFGVYLQWNQTNIIRADVGFSDEGASGGVSFGLLF